MEPALAPGPYRELATPLVDDPVPVRAVGPAGPGADRRGHHRDVFAEGRCWLAGHRDGS